MIKKFTVRPPIEISRKRITASVGFVSPKDMPGVYVVVRNKRGWDVPGGHVEEGELPLEAFIREAEEEAACEVMPDAQLIAVLESMKNPATGIAFYKGTCVVKSFEPHDEVQEIAFMEETELIQRYFGDQELLKELLTLIH